MKDEDTGRQPASQILAALVENHARERLTVADIVEALGERGLGLLMLLFALPGLIPIPLPAMGGLLAGPLAIISLHLAVGRQRLWLPRRFMAREIARQDLAALVGRGLPYLKRLERLAKPRFSQFTTMPAERLVGFVGLVLSLLFSLPIPLTNPVLALPLCLFALGLLEQDGVFILAGHVGALIGGGFVIAVGWALTEGLLALVGGALG